MQRLTPPPHPSPQETLHNSGALLQKRDTVTTVTTAPQPPSPSSFLKLRTLSGVKAVSQTQASLSHLCVQRILEKSASLMSFSCL